MESVFVVRDIEERSIYGIFQHQEDAEACMASLEEECRDLAARGGDDVTVLDHYEMIEILLS